MKRPLIALLALIVLAPTLPGVAAVAAAADEPTVTTTALRGPLHLLQGSGGNVVASVGDDGVLLVDDDFPDYAEAYRGAIDTLAKAEWAPRFVVNTHWHNDHSGANAYWGERGAVIVAHSNVRARMSTRQEIKALGRVVEPSPPQALPVVTYGDSAALHFNGDDIELQHYPAGHTDGDTVVFYSKENVVHMGDLFFNGGFPFIDLSSGGTVAGYIANVAAVLAKVDDETVIVPGHGALARRADLVRYHEMLATTSAQVAAALAAGKSVDAITAEGLGAQWADWGKGFIKEAQWISTLAAGR